MKHATTTTKMKKAMVKVEPNTIHTINVGASVRQPQRCCWSDKSAYYLNRISASLPADLQLLPSELVPKSLAQNAAAAKLLMSLGSMASPVLKIQAASRHSAINSILKRSLTRIGLPSTLEPVGLTNEYRRPDALTLGLWYRGLSLVSMGCNSCGYFCSGPLQRLCQTGRFRSYKS